MENKTKKCIKGFDHELKCRDFQYEVGKSYKLPEGEHVEICKNGFHAIDEGENPLKVFSYYSPYDNNGVLNRYCEVEIGGETQKHGSKIVGSEIRIVREIGLQGVIYAYNEWVKHNPEIGVLEENAYYSVVSNTGVCSVASNTGVCSVAYNTGNGSVSFNMGACSVAVNKGSNSGVMNTGVCSFAIAEGKDSVAVASGYEGCVKGALGCAIMAVERGGWHAGHYSITSIAAGIVDGVKIKVDTWYRCVNGELVEAV